MWDQALLLLEAAHVLVRACTSPMFRYKLVHELFKGLCKITFEICKILTRRQAGNISHGYITSNEPEESGNFLLQFLIEPMKKKGILPDASPVSDQVGRQHSAISLSYRRADTSQGRQHLSTPPDTVNRAALWHWYLGQPGCVSHLSPSSATAELTRVC